MKEIRVDTLSEIGMGIYGGGGSDPLRPLEVGKTGGGDDVSYNGGDPYSGHCGSAWSNYDDAVALGNTAVGLVNALIGGPAGKLIDILSDQLINKPPSCPADAVSNPYPGA